MADRDSDDSDAPEEFTSQQAIEADEQIRKVQKESTARVARERKERQRLWAKRITPRPSKGNKGNKESLESLSHEDEELHEEVAKDGMLSNDIVNLLAAREKQVFLSDSEEEKVDEKLALRKKKRKGSGSDPVILNEIPPAQCLQNSLEFLKKKKMQVPRSNSVLENSNQALRFITSSGLLGKN